eukprot:COSAG01_NODE_1261_length_11001_cov_11.811961_5_plen_128_part_00
MREDVGTLRLRDGADISTLRQPCRAHERAESASQLQNSAVRQGASQKHDESSKNDSASEQPRNKVEKARKRRDPECKPLYNRERDAPIYAFGRGDRFDAFRLGSSLTLPLKHPKLKALLMDHRAGCH